MSAVDEKRVRWPVDPESVPIDAVCPVVSTQAQCPDEILYENSALRRRAHGRWHLIGVGSQVRCRPAGSGELTALIGA